MNMYELTAVALQVFWAKYVKEHQPNISNEDLQDLKGKERRKRKAEATVCKYIDFLIATWTPFSPDEGWSKTNTQK